MIFMIKYETMHKIFAGPMGIIARVRNTTRKTMCGSVSRKQFCANGVGLRV